MLDIKDVLESQQKLIESLEEHVKVLEETIKLHKEINTQNESVIRNLSSSLELAEADISLLNKIIEELK